MTDAFIIGIAQAVAVLPGLSRSGSTIATGIIIGDKREQVASFSFFMVIIPILGEALLDLKKIFLPSSEAIAGTESIGWLPMAVGFIAAFVMGCLACKWMIELVKRGKLIWLGILCILW
jgi:undecaprenyl-diphosphatase